MSDDDPLKMEEIRRFSAIYGRFDCKRKPEKPLTLHEVSFFFDNFSKKFTILNTFFKKSNRTLFEHVKTLFGYY